MALPPLALNLSYPDRSVMNLYISMAAELGIKRMSLDSVTLKKAAEDP